MADFAEGYDYFDGSQKETFAAALILLCLDEDAAFHSAFVELVRQHCGLPGLTKLIAWGREAALESELERSRRSDLWLRFEDGLVLVEIKTHSAWEPSSVSAQMADQSASALDGVRVTAALLLAPDTLLRRLRSPSSVLTLPWRTLLKTAEAIDHPTRILQLAREHWSRTVERDFGLPGPAVSFTDLASQTACLVAFLRAAFLRIGGEAQGDTVWFSSPDGQPRSKRGWAWIGMAVPGKVPALGRVYIGVYTYTAAPSSDALGTFLEAYRFGRDDEPIASIPFGYVDLERQSLEPTLERLVEILTQERPG